METNKMGFTLFRTEKGSRSFSVPSETIPLAFSTIQWRISLSFIYYLAIVFRRLNNDEISTCRLQLSGISTRRNHRSLLITRPCTVRRTPFGYIKAGLTVRTTSHLADTVRKFGAEISDFVGSAGGWKPWSAERLASPYDARDLATVPLYPRDNPALI